MNECFQWLTITAACGFAMILLNWLITNLHGDGDKLPAHSVSSNVSFKRQKVKMSPHLKEFRYMVIGASLFIASGVQSFQLHTVCTSLI